MQMGVTREKETADAIFVTRHIQEKFIDKNKQLYYAFIDLEKAFDWAPRKVVKWTLRKMVVEE